MEWFLSLFTEWKISSVILLGFVLLSIIVYILSKYGKKVSISPLHILFVGTFIAAVVHFWPWYSLQLTPWQTALNSIQHAFRLFSFDGDFVEKVAGFDRYPPEIKEFYVTYGSFLYVFAPIMTLTFIFSFFKNIVSHFKYFCTFWTTTHVFSELNEKTLSLAISLSKKSKRFLFVFPRETIVFTDIIYKNEEQSLELVDKAKKLDAILFNKDIESIRFKRKYSLRKVNFYLISEDESEKIRHAESIMDNYDFKKVKLHVFSDDVRTELLMTTKVTKNIEVIRVNDIQMLIYDNLDKNGINLFQRARSVEGEKEKVISAVIVGLGRYGREMLKALTWYGQLEGYKLKINVFDVDKKAEEKFKELCPELMSDNYNKKEKTGEPYYEITINSGVDINVPDFENKLKEITDATYIFVCLGTDEMNLNVATKIRAMSQRINYLGDGRKPDIETVIYDSNVKKRMGVSWDEIKDFEEYSADQEKYSKKYPNKGKPVYGATNFKTEQYQILMIGDLGNFYSYGTVITSEIIKAGFDIHFGYSIDFSKISFVERQMLDDWKQFLKAKGLEQSWDKFLSEWKKKNKLGEKDAFDLTSARSEFSFMKDDETKENTTFALSTDNAALNRIIEWEKAIYNKFNELLKNPIFAKEWEKIEKEMETPAKKSFLFEYNYRSSIAKAIHKRLREKLDFKQGLFNKDWDSLTLEEKIARGTTEHIRWNAYMRTEGYSYAPKRSDLGKVHHNLVPVSDLSNDDLRKDA